MIFSITIFAFSLVAIVLMIWLKRAEITSGRRFSFLRWTYKSDHLVRRTFVHTREFVAMKQAQVYFVIIKTLRKMIDVLVGLRKNILLKSAKFLDLVKGKGHFSDKSSSTLFKQPPPEEPEHITEIEEEKK